MRTSLSVILLLIPPTQGARRNPSWDTVTIDFEALAGIEGHDGCNNTCQLSTEVAYGDQLYETLGTRFTGPGYGQINGGVLLNKCSLTTGQMYDLEGYDGECFLGFSTIHKFETTEGKPISPETIRFDDIVTNLHLKAAVLGSHPIRVTAFSGVHDSFNDYGEVLETVTKEADNGGVTIELTDSRNYFVDCIRRIEIYSEAKIFLIDELIFDRSSKKPSECFEPVLNPADDGSISPATTATGGMGFIAFCLTIWCYVLPSCCIILAGH